MIECAYCKTLCPSLLFAREMAPFPDGPLRKPSSEQRIERARAEAEKPENKGKKWYQGLDLPGTLDLKEFEFKDEKLGVAFEDEEVVSCLDCVHELIADGAVAPASPVQLPVPRLRAHVKRVAGTREAHVSGTRPRVLQTVYEAAVAVLARAGAISAALARFARPIALAPRAETAPPQVGQREGASQVVGHAPPCVRGRSAAEGQPDNSSARRRSLAPTSCLSTCARSTRSVSCAREWATGMSSG